MEVGWRVERQREGETEREGDFSLVKQRPCWCERVAERDKERERVKQILEGERVVADGCLSVMGCLLIDWDID